MPRSDGAGATLGAITRASPNGWTTGGPGERDGDARQARCERWAVLIGPPVCCRGEHDDGGQRTQVSLGVGGSVFLAIERIVSTTYRSASSPRTWSSQVSRWTCWDDGSASDCSRASGPRATNGFHGTGS